MPKRCWSGHAMSVMGAAVLVFVGLAGDARTEPLNCPAYAAAALAQNDQNQMLHCGFSGPRWSSDFAAHVHWCQTATMADLTREDGERKAMLQGCSDKPKQDQAACEVYAREAVAQFKANQGRGCGLSGGAWSEDYAGHFSWCLPADPDARAAANHGRNLQLAGCFAAQKSAQETAAKDACAAYATTAATQQSENAQRQCGFSGGRWSGDWNAHFQWCLGAPPGATGAEAAVRTTALTSECMRLVCTSRDEVSPLPPFFSTVTSCRNVPR